MARTIKIPDSVNISMIEPFMKASEEGKYTDDVLGNGIAMMKFVEAFVRATGDCPVLVSSLRGQIETFERAKQYRERD